MTRKEKIKDLKEYKLYLICKKNNKEYIPVNKQNEKGKMLVLRKYYNGKQFNIY